MRGIKRLERINGVEYWVTDFTEELRMYRRLFGAPREPQPNTLTTRIRSTVAKIWPFSRTGRNPA